MCRDRFVSMIAPGCTALAVIPCSRQRAVAPTAKSTLAVLDCP